MDIPYGSAAGPGLEATCRGLERSKYCHNFITSYDEYPTTATGAIADLVNSMMKNSVEDFNRLHKMPGNFLQNSGQVGIKTNNYEHNSYTLIQDGPVVGDLPKLSEVLVQRNSYIAKVHSSLTEALVQSNLWDSKDTEDVRLRVTGILIFLWQTVNLVMGPFIGMPFPYHGMCYPDACTKDDIHINNVQFAHRLFNHTNLPTIAASPKLPATFLGSPLQPVNEVGCSDDAKYSGAWKPENYAVVTLFSIIGVFVIMGTAADIYHRNVSEKQNLIEKKEVGLGFKLLLSFSLVSNLEFIFKATTQKGSNRLDCFEGMRAISMTWVILGHNFAFGRWFIHGRNKRYIQAISGDQHAGGMAFEAVMQGEYSVDSFLYFGATLLSYLLLKDLDKSGGWFHSRGPLRILFFYLNRYLRIMIPHALVIAAVVGVIPLLVTGYMGAEQLATSDAEDCKVNWYRHLLYYNIWGKSDGSADGCIGQTWYLAFDMEWFLVSPLVVYPLWLASAGSYRRVCGLLWWAAVFCALFTANILYILNQGAWDSYHTQHLLPQWNFAPWGHRSFCYMQGLLMGYILHVSKVKEVKIHWILNLSLWTLTSLLGFSLVYGPYSIPPNPAYIPAFRYFYKAAWGVCLSWVTFACVKGYGGPVNDLLSWGLWAPVSKISFMTYLLHMSPNWQYFAMQVKLINFYINLKRFQNNVK